MAHHPSNVSVACPGTALQKQHRHLEDKTTGKKIHIPDRHECRCRKCNKTAQHALDIQYTQPQKKLIPHKITGKAWVGLEQTYSTLTISFVL